MKNPKGLWTTLNVANLFEKEGLLSQAIEGFAPRESQQKMAYTIEQVIAQQGQLIVEAGTGTGKSFGYLVPVFAAQKKAIISTGTKTLQDQLFFKDIPVLQKIFKSPRKIVLLKGRANYVCYHRLERSLESGTFHSRQQVTQLHVIKEWSMETQTGDVNELNAIPEDSPVWSEVTSTADNCLNQDCLFYKKCFVIKARQQALAADIVIVNHHLFFADMLLQTEGQGELLPGAEVVVFDEAHHLPEIASQFFSASLTARQLLELSRDSEIEVLKEAADMQVIVDMARRLQHAVQGVRSALGLEVKKSCWPATLSPELHTQLMHLALCLQQLESVLKEAAVRGKGLESCWKRVVKFIAQLHIFLEEPATDTVHWYETYPRSFSFHSTPIVVADYFKHYLKEKARAWIFTSATLAVRNSFHLFRETLGLDQALQLQLNSPFDYEKQALLYVPRALPDPKENGYAEKMTEAIVPVLEMTEGRAFLLFTSYKAMERVAVLLKDRISYPLLIQGMAPKHQLIQQFKQLGHAVLLGTNSFWYGVDLKGDVLSCVIIDKLPFAAPDDPILQAKIRMFRRQHKDPFYEYQLPQAVLMLKQGAGRLIRDSGDRGILVVCDPRLVGARYGEIFLQSLPTMSRTRELTTVSDFFKL